MKAFIDQWLGPASVIISLVLAVPIFWTWFELVWGRRARHRKWMRQIRQGASPENVLFVVDLLPKQDIYPSVIQYAGSEDKLTQFSDESIFRINRDKPTSIEDIPSLVGEIKMTVGEIMRRGPKQIHFFYGGPGAISALIGAELKNFAYVFVYQHGPNRGWEYWGPLYHQSVD